MVCSWHGGRLCGAGWSGAGGGRGSGAATARSPSGTGSDPARYGVFAPHRRMRLSKQTSAVLVSVLCAGAAAGCGGASGTNVIVGSTYGGSVHLVIDDGAGSGVEP